MEVKDYQNIFDLWEQNAKNALENGDEILYQEEEDLSEMI